MLIPHLKETFVNFTFPPKTNLNLNKEAVEVTLPFLELAKRGTYLFHKTRRDSRGNALAARTNGKVAWARVGDNKTWRQPMKYGFRECFDISRHNASEWLTDDPQVQIVTLPELGDSYRAHLYVEKSPSGNWQLFWGYNIVDYKLEHHDIARFDTKAEAQKYALDTYGIKPIWLHKASISDI
jgi:hypothetical protein